MEIRTRDFGTIQINEEDIITFKSPIYGFEAYHKFVFLYMEDISEHFVWLQSVEEPELCFLLANPELVMDHYAPEIPKDIQELLGPEDYMCWLVMVVKDTLEDSTVNLRSPIVVNPVRKCAAQIILDAKLSVHQPLMKREGK